MTQIRYAIVGCGTVATRHVEAITKLVPNAQIVACCDVDRSAARELVAGLDIPFFTSTEAMYQSVEIDVIVIATPNGYHHHHAIEALVLGKHVVVEKPMALRLEDADEMIHEARRNKCKLWVAFQNRYNPSVRKAKEAVETGRLGKLVLGTVRIRWCRDANYYRRSWHGTWSLDGGVTAQQAIHHLDALRWFLGEVESVEATCSTQLANIESEDLSLAIFHFKSGALGLVEAMTTARPRDFEASLSIMGEGGTIVLGGLAMNNIDVWEFSQSQADDLEVPRRYSQEIPNAMGFGHDTLHQRVMASIFEGGVVEISGEEGRNSLELVHAIYASHEQGRRVWMKDVPVSSKLGVPAAKLETTR